MRFFTFLKPFRSIHLSILLLVSISAVQAQNGNGKILGKVVDSLSSQPIEYATIRLLKQPEGNLINGSVVEANGTFKLDHLEEGTYKLVIDFMGYKSVSRDVVVEKGNLHIDVGTIKMTADLTLLNEVVVTSQKNVIENRIDKIIYNAEADVTSQVGVATDVLKKVPQVSVDIDGNVELQGSSSVRFLINGKPSALFGINITEVLQSIPASQIQTIEVITIPGAKYDAAGTGGIINIILKKNKADGTNGSTSLSVGTRLENASLNLNMRKGKFGVNSFFSGNAQLTSTRLNNSDQVSQEALLTNQLLQQGESDFNRQGFETGIGVDWDLSEKDNFQGSVGYNYFANNSSGYADREFITKDNSGNILADRYDAIFTTNNFRERAVNYQLGYKRKFNKEDHEIEFGYNSTIGNSNSFYEQRQENPSPEGAYGGSRGNNPGVENQTNVTVDYLNAISENVQIETGAKTQIDHINSQSDVYQLNTPDNNFEYSEAQSSTLEYNRQIYAGYLSATFKLTNKLSFKSGARYEYTTAVANFSNSGKINFDPYSIIVPSAVLMNTLSENRSIKLSYTRRIERPDYGDLNPFINASDPRNISTGNPNLKPEITDRVEVSFNQNIKAGNVVATIFLRNNTDDIQPYTRFYSEYEVGDSTYNNVTVRIRENIGHENNYGVDLFTAVALTQKLNLRVSVQCFERYIYSGISTIANVHGFNLRTNMNATYNVSPTLTCELFGSYRSQMTNAQGTRPSFTSYVFAFRKQFLNKKASIAFTATNFISKYIKQETKVTGDNFTLNTLQQVPYRSFGINLTYRFGGFKKDDEESNLPAVQEN